MLKMLSDIDHNVSRSFQFDYIICDAVLLALFVLLLIWQRRYRPLLAGIVCGLVVYVIDGVVWSALGVREYDIPAPWIKHPVDFMMDFSYGVVAFGWMWIAFEKRSKADVAFWTCVVFCGWCLVPIASLLAPLDDNPIMTVRHMESQVTFQIGMVVVGYGLLAVLKYNIKTIVYLFWVGCMLGFMMEFPLLVTKIRPAGYKLLIYETLILFNQGVPYLYLIWDNLLPASKARNGAGYAAREKL